MKKLMLGLGLFLFSLTISVQTVRADMGPKPSLVVTIKGVDEPYSFDLLTDNGNIDDFNEEWYDFDMYYDANGYPNPLIDYQDDNGYSSYFLYDTPSSISQVSAHVYEMNYLAPDEFRIVLYLKDADTIVVSKRIETDSFDATVTWDLTGVDLSRSSVNHGLITGTTTDNPWSLSHWYVTGLRAIGRVVMTLLFELGILYLFRVRKKQAFVHVGIVNVVTQLTLSVLVILSWVAGGPFFYILALLLLEFVVLLVEFIAYIVVLKQELKPGMILLYAVIANAASFGFSIIAVLFL